eukprot:gb/GFBE01060138.1/.p1 GENE.gb/GFBE01060138.1/~~gb/GFBE01060138.1/.p1  ORF type:complete len:283 (+),score=60.04 gb/GFBE01060138.1/:1-849(+)
MVRVGLLFELSDAEAVPGESIVVTGQRPELGSWVPLQERRAERELRTSVLSYPRWILPSVLWLEVDDDEQMVHVEYKYVKARHGKHVVQWEDGIPNRCVRIPCKDSGSVWLVQDACWNSTTAWSNTVTPMSPVEIISVRSALEPSSAAQQSPDGVLWVQSLDSCRGGSCGGSSGHLLSPRPPDDNKAVQQQYPIEREFEACWSPKKGRRLQLPPLALEESGDPSGTAEALLAKAKAEIKRLNLEKQLSDQECERLRGQLVEDPTRHDKRRSLPASVNPAIAG